MNKVDIAVKLRRHDKITHNQSIIKDIITHCAVKNGTGKYFLRWSTNPFDDVDVGFTAPHQYGGFLSESLNPFADTMEDAVEIMHNTETEQHYFTIRQLSYQDDTLTEKEISESKVYNAHNFPGSSAHTCPPVYDIRNNKVIINPEFGLSAYALGENPTRQSVQRLIDSLSNGLPNQNIFWHVFTATHYHHSETNSQRPDVKNSDKIVCMLGAKVVNNVTDFYNGK